VPRMVCALQRRSDDPARGFGPDPIRRAVPQQCLRERGVLAPVILLPLTVTRLPSRERLLFGVISCRLFQCLSCSDMLVTGTWHRCCNTLPQSSDGQASNPHDSIHDQGHHTMGAVAC
jgi:hypothetical protein